MITMTAVGRIGRDVELRYTPNGTAVCNIALGCNYGQRGQDNKQPTQWLDCVLWNKRAEALAEHLTKGKQIIVTLKDVHVETFDLRDGGQGTKLIGDVQELEFGASPQGNGNHDNGGGQQQRQQPRGNGNGGGQRNSAPQNRQQPQQKRQSTGGGASGFDDLEDDIPF